MSRDSSSIPAGDQAQSAKFGGSAGEAGNPAGEIGGPVGEIGGPVDEIGGPVDEAGSPAGEIGEIGGPVGEIGGAGDERSSQSASSQPADRAASAPNTGDTGTGDGRRYDQSIPRLPRGRGVKLSMPELIRIAMFAALLVAVLALRKPCADNIGGFVESFEPPPADQVTAPAPNPLPPGDYIRLPPDITEDELRARIEELRAATEAEAAAANGDSDSDDHDSDGADDDDSDGANDDDSDGADDDTAATSATRDQGATAPGTSRASDGADSASGDAATKADRAP